MTTPTPDLTVEPTETATPVARDTDVVLAGLHLRLGSLALARAELETLSARGALDLPGRVDLAEARWRTGDLIGAGDAAREAMAGGDGSPVALVVAAEAASALGRPSEARRLAGLAMAAVDGPIDPLFAGMPRSGVWPADPTEPAPLPETLFPPDRSPAAAAAAAAAASMGTPSPAAGEPARGAAVVAAAVTVTDDAEPGFWDLPAVAASDPEATTPTGHGPPPGLDPAVILDAGEAALRSGDYASAALHLGLVVRVTPSLAPVILEAIGETPDAGLQMVRGDAYRAVGREADARRAYEAAMAAAGSAVRLEPEPEMQPMPEADLSGDDDLELDPDDDSDPFAGEP